MLEINQGDYLVKIYRKSIFNFLSQNFRLVYRMMFFKHLRSLSNTFNSIVKLKVLYLGFSSNQNIQLYESFFDS